MLFFPESFTNMTHFSLRWLLVQQVIQGWQQGKAMEQVWQMATVPQPVCSVAMAWRTLRLRDLTAPRQPPAREWGAGGFAGEENAPALGRGATLGYGSALCQGLRGRAGPSADRLAAAMVADWPPQSAGTGAMAWHCHQNAGWLTYDLAIAELEPWLTRLAEPLPPRPETATPLPWPTAEQLFQLQATHARCCRLLAQREDRPALAMMSWITLVPQAYGWLQGAIATTDAWQADQLGLAHPPLWQPLLQLVAGFEQIHRQTPLWGQLAPAQRQGYLGLVLITQQLLGQLLGWGWGIPAWTTL